MKIEIDDRKLSKIKLKMKELTDLLNELNNNDISIHHLKEKILCKGKVERQVHHLNLIIENENENK